MNEQIKTVTRSHGTSGNISDVSNSNNKILKLLNDMNAKIDTNHKHISKQLEEQKLYMHKEINKALKDFENHIGIEFSKKFDEHTGQLNAIETRCDHQERIMKLDDIIIKGIPKTQQENLLDIFSLIGSALGFEHDKYCAVKNIIRIGNMSGHSAANKVTTSFIIVTFGSQIFKREFMNKYYKRLNLNLGDIGYSLADRIYISDSLTKGNNVIQSLAHKLKTNGIIEKIQIRSGIVFVKYPGDAAFTKIENINQLPQVIDKINKPKSSLNAADNEL